MTLGEKIKSLRNEKRITQKDLANRLNVSFQTISKWEKDENEPDISTLRELSKIFECSVDYLLSEDEPEKKEKETPSVPPQQTIVIHQKEQHVCEYCKKDIPEDDLEMEQLCVRKGGRGHSSTYRPAYYHKECLEKVKKIRADALEKQLEERASKGSKKTFGWGITGGILALAISLVIMLLVPEAKAVIHPALAVLYSILIGYAIFAMIYCILSGSYIGEVFVACATFSVKFPAIIFSWDLDGFAWLIAMKVLFAILGFFIGLLAVIFAIIFSAILGGFSFPFVLIHNVNTHYEDLL